MKLIVVSLLALAACAGGAREAAMMPTPILCKTVMEDLTPVYLRYGEYMAELRNRNESCVSYVGATTTIRIR